MLELTLSAGECVRACYIGHFYYIAVDGIARVVSLGMAFLLFSFFRAALYNNYILIYTFNIIICRKIVNYNIPETIHAQLRVCLCLYKYV